MRTGSCGLLGTSVLLLVDIVWSFSGPMGWGNNGECGVGNAQLQMSATIVRKKDGTTSEWSVPESAMIACANISGSTDQFKIRVKWSWDVENILTTPSTAPSFQSTKVPEVAKSTSLRSTTADSTTTAAPTQADSTHETSSTAKPKKKRDSDYIFMGKDMEPSSDSGTSITGTSATGGSTVTQVSLRTDDPRETGVSGTKADATTITADVSSSTTDGSSSTTDVSSSTTDVSSSTADVSSSTTDISTSTTDATTEVLVTRLVEVINRRSGPFRPKGILERFQEPPEIIRSCYPYCDGDEDSGLIRFEEPHKNRLTFTVAKSTSLFHVSDIYLRYELPDEKVVYRVYWKNVKLFQGPLDATHVCENATKLPLNAGAELVLQSTKLAAFLPQDHCEFPKSEADCNCKYEEEEENRFCKTAEIIMITVGAIVGVLLLSGLCFYIGKLYCKSRREREARDTIP